MKNIFKIFKKKKIETLTNKLIKELQKNGLKLDPTCSEISIWVHDGADVQINHTGNKEILQNYGKFKLHKAVE